MPVAALFCKSSPPLQNKMVSKVRRKMSKPVTPENKMVKLAEEDDSITVTYTLKLTKDKIGEDTDDPTWKDAVWTALLAMRNLDDELVIRPNAHLEDSFKSFGNTNCVTVNTCFMAEALTQAMLRPEYKEFKQK